MHGRSCRRAAIRRTDARRRDCNACAQRRSRGLRGRSRTASVGSYVAGAACAAYASVSVAGRSRARSSSVSASRRMQSCRRATRFARAAMGVKRGFAVSTVASPIACVRPVIVECASGFDCRPSRVQPRPHIDRDRSHAVLMFVCWNAEPAALLRTAARIGRRMTAYAGAIAGGNRRIAPKTCARKKENGVTFSGPPRRRDPVCVGDRGRVACAGLPIFPATTRGAAVRPSPALRLRRRFASQRCRARPPAAARRRRLSIT